MSVFLAGCNDDGDSGPPREENGVEAWVVMLDDGPGNATIGCLFTIKAGVNVDVDPTDYIFYIGEKGKPLQKLDWSERNQTYSIDSGSGGDDASKFSEGETIGQLYDQIRKRRSTSFR